MFRFKNLVIKEKTQQKLKQLYLFEWKWNIFKKLVVKEKTQQNLKQLYLFEWKWNILISPKNSFPTKTCQLNLWKLKKQELHKMLCLNIDWPPFDTCFSYKWPVAVNGVFQWPMSMNVNSMKHGTNCSASFLFHCD